MRDLLPDPPAREPDVLDRFERGPDPDLWIPAYLPHWTTPERAAARWQRVDDGLLLRIDADQPLWRPEDAPLRVSNLQTGVFAGPVGSTRGTHRHRDDLRVRTATPTRMLWAPSAGRVDVTLTASSDPGCMAAVWLVGAEVDDPAHSGEICVVEIDGRQPAAETTTVRCGVKAHHDPRLVTDMAEVEVVDGVDRPRTWTAVWGPEGTVIGCDGRVLRRVAQAPSYPLVLMVDLFQLSAPAGAYPKTATVHEVRGWGS